MWLRAIFVYVHTEGLSSGLQAAYCRALIAVAVLHTHMSTEASQVVVPYYHLSE